MGLRDKDVSYDEPPKHVKNEKGRICIEKPILRARKDMTPVYDYEPKQKKTEDKVPEAKAFDLAKATKQQIVNKAQEEFGKELSMDSTAKVLREQFKELMDASDNDS